MTDNLGSLLIHSDKSNGSTVFEDSSGATWTGSMLTATNATHSTAHAKFGATSMDFTAGDDSRLALTLTTGIVLGIGDFTIDYWEYKEAGSSENGATAFMFGDGECGLTLVNMGESYTILSTKNGSIYELSPATNQWNHIAITRAGSIIRLFINGALKSSMSESGTFGDGLSPLGIGNRSTGDYPYDGYIDEFRIVKGEALWTANFTTPTEPHAPTTATTLLLHSDESNGSTVFEDSSGQPAVLSNAVSGYLARHSTTHAKFGDTSMDFTSDPEARVVVPLSPPLMLNTEDFTIDFWEYKVSGSREIMAHAFWIGGSYGTGMYRHVYNTVYGPELSTVIKIEGGFDRAVAKGTTMDQWNHIALTRSGSTFRLFFNGVIEYSFTFTGRFVGEEGGLTIGNRQTTPYSYDGYIDEFRIVKGEAIWTADFTPPTEPYGFVPFEWYTEYLDAPAKIALRGLFTGGSPGVSRQQVSNVTTGLDVKCHIVSVAPLTKPLAYGAAGVSENVVVWELNYMYPLELGLAVSVWNDDEFDPTGSIEIYLLSLTGYKDGYGEVFVPMESFQARLRSGEKSYLSVSIPGTEYASEIEKRPNADIRIVKCQKKDGVIINQVEIANVEMDYINVYDGAVNQSIVLSGHKAETFYPKEITLKNGTYTSTVDGKLRARFPYPDLYLKPGDTINIGDDQIVAALITIYMSASQQSMEVAEA